MSHLPHLFPKSFFFLKSLNFILCVIYANVVHKMQQANTTLTCVWYGRGGRFYKILNWALRVSDILSITFLIKNVDGWKALLRFEVDCFRQTPLNDMMFLDIKLKIQKHLHIQHLQHNFYLRKENISIVKQNSQYMTFLSKFTFRNIMFLSIFDNMDFKLEHLQLNLTNHLILYKKFIRRTAITFWEMMPFLFLNLALSWP